MAALGGLTLIGSSVACCGLLFLLICIGLVVWYFFKQPNMEVSATAPEPVIQATIEHPVAAPSAPAPEPAAPASVFPPPAEKTPSADE